MSARDQVGVLAGAFGAGVGGRAAAGTEEPQAVPAGSGGRRFTKAMVGVTVGVVARRLAVVVAVGPGVADGTGAPQAATAQAMRTVRTRRRLAWSVWVGPAAASRACGSNITTNTRWAGSSLHGERQG
jgi:hypothetical protein